MPLHFPHHHHHHQQKPGAAPIKLAIVGTFIDAPTPNYLRVRRDTVIVINESSGKIENITPRKEWECSTAVIRIVDLRENENTVVVPGFVDCHVHAPQYRQLGTKTDVPLMEWLNRYTFPAEAAFTSPAHARKVYSQLIRRLLRNGTTTALYYGSNHLTASLILAEICGEYGQRALVGKTCSDQLVPEYYVETTRGSLEDTEKFIMGVRERFGKEDEGALVLPVVTPRFVPTCSLELLGGLGELAGRYSCHIQTHAAESVDQVALVRSQYPDLLRDVAILATYNLLTPKTVLAHCTHLYDSEASALAAAGVSIASCPCSNILFARAILPINRFATLGVKIGLGTDIAGGWSASMVDSIRMAALVSRIDAFQPPRDRTADPRDKGNTEEKGDREGMSYKKAFHLGTRGGAVALGLEVGLFEVGMRWDAVQADLGWEEEEAEVEDVDVEAMFERWVCGHGGEQGVRRVWVNGEEVFCRI